MIILFYLLQCLERIFSANSKLDGACLYERPEINDKQLLPEAKSFWETSLLVLRSSGRIRLLRKCETNKVLSRPGEKVKNCIGGCAATSCGPVLVPDDHLFQCRYCEQSDVTGSHCGRSGVPDGVGISDADFLLYVSSVHTERCENSETIAYAAHCQLEELLDRPIAGYVNLCPNSLSADVRELEVLLSTVKHELLHTLGFSSALYAFYRDEKGLPRTPRDKHGRPHTFDKERGVYQWDNNTVATMPRKWWTRTGIIDHTVQVAVTPRVQAEARKHFNCSELEGAELENQGHAGTALTHWEKRLFENEAMTGTHTQNPVYSRLTLAFMEDTGWYRANYSTAERLHWGSALGCDFAMKSCGEWIRDRLKSGKSPSPFCINVKSSKSLKYAKTTCTDARDSVALCNLVKNAQALPKEYQYFSELDHVEDLELKYYGGSVELADFCPFNQEFEWKVRSVDESGNSSMVVRRDSRCELEENEPRNSSNAALEDYGYGSKCFSQAQPWSQRDCVVRRSFQHYGAGCYQYPCFHEGQIIYIRRLHENWLHEGQVICPACSALCEACELDKIPGFEVGDPEPPGWCSNSERLRSHFLIFFTPLFIYICI